MGTYKDLTYSGTGKYFIYSGSDPITWSEGEFTRTGNSNNPSYPYYYHASGLNTNGIVHYFFSIEKSQNLPCI